MRLLRKTLRPSYGISDGGIRRWNLITFGTTICASLLSNLWQILYPYQPVLAGERQRLVRALRLGHSEDSVVAGIVYFDLAAVFDRPSSSAGENCVLKVILCADCTRRSEIAGPPI